MDTLDKYDTIKNADSVEWCPHEPHNLFVCGNYELIEKEHSSHRSGRILLFSVKDNRLNLMQTINTAGVLDQKWCHERVNGHIILAVANSESSIEIYELRDSKLQFLSRTVAGNGDGLILSLDWSTGKYTTETPNLICSNSNGYIHLFELNPDFTLKEKNKFCGHNFEAWIAAYNYWNPNVFYSGGDDSLLLMFDERVSNVPILKNRSHSAGVTSMHSNKKYENLLASGSYDSVLRLWDVRKLKEPTTSLELPGTLWRLKWNPIDDDYLLAACMMGGAFILQLSNHCVNAICHYEEHKNLVYGCDWCYSERDNKFFIGTCSFYDHLLCLSSFKINE